MLKNFVKSRAGVLWLGMLVTLLYFVILWCMDTTFRAMSNWILYPANILLSLILTIPYMVTKRMWAQIVTMAVVQLVLIANLMYCRTYFAAIPLDCYLLACNLTDFTASVTDSMRISDVGFMLITIGTAMLAHWTPRPESFGNAWRVFGCSTVAFALVCGIGVAAKGGFMKEIERISQSCYYSTTVTPVYTITGHLLYQSLSRPDILTDELTDEVELWMEGKNALMPYRALADSVERRHSLVLVLCESLESWVLEREIDGHPITPYLNSLIADSTTFYAPEVLTQVAAGRSIDAQLLINCGLLPMRHSVYSMKYPSTHYPSLNKAMKEQWSTRSYFFSADKPITWNQIGVSRSFGCDSVFDRSEWVTDEVIGSPAKLSDGSFLRQVVQKLVSGTLWPEGESRYITIVTYSGHNPFVLPDKLKDPTFAPVTQRYPQRMADYINMVHYTDNALQTFVDYLRSRPDYKDLLVVITGDHEGLASDRGQLLTDPRANGIVAEGQFTPLIILNSPISGRYDNVMGQVDIYPTILNLTGLDNYYWKGLGNSAFSPTKPSFAISSMTGEIAGDTTSLKPGVMSLMMEARNISDAMITFDMFRKF